MTTFPGREKTALVLSAGGLLGAYQAGVWGALAPHWQPDLVIGVSVGTLNGWAIAGGCRPEHLADRWRSLGEALAIRWQVPRSPLDGFVDSGPIRAEIHALHRDFQPRVPYGLTLTRLPLPRPHLVQGEQVTASHLLAACAIPGVYRQYRLDGTLFTDGGVLDPVPLWAAAELGATRIVAVSTLPSWPWYFRALARISGKQVANRLAKPALPTFTIAPETPLGTRWDTVSWTASNIERWVERGYQDGERFLKGLQAHVFCLRSY